VSSIAQNVKKTVGLECSPRALARHFWISSRIRVGGLLGSVAKSSCFGCCLRDRVFARSGLVGARWDRGFFGSRCAYPGPSKSAPKASSASYSACVRGGVKARGRRRSDDHGSCRLSGHDSVFIGTHTCERSLPLGTIAMLPVDRRFMASGGYRQHPPRPDLISSTRASLAL